MSVLRACVLWQVSVRQRRFRAANCIHPAHAAWLCMRRSWIAADLLLTSPSTATGGQSRTHLLHTEP